MPNHFTKVHLKVLIQEKEEPLSQDMDEPDVMADDFQSDSQSEQGSKDSSESDNQEIIEDSASEKYLSSSEDSNQTVTKPKESPVQDFWPENSATFGGRKPSKFPKKYYWKY